MTALTAPTVFTGVSLLTAPTFEADQLFDLESLAEFTLDFEAALTAVFSDPNSPVATALTTAPTVVSDTRLLWGSLTSGFEVTGQGLGPLAALAQGALIGADGGLPGTIETARILSGGDTILELILTPETATFRSGAQELIVTGALPTESGPVFDLLLGLVAVFELNDSAESSAEFPTELMAVLDALVVESATLRDADTEILGLTNVTNLLTITFGGATLALEGSFEPEDLSLLLEGALNLAAGAPDLGLPPDITLSGFRLFDSQGALLLGVSNLEGALLDVFTSFTPALFDISAIIGTDAVETLNYDDLTLSQLEATTRLSDQSKGSLLLLEDTLAPDAPLVGLLDIEQFSFLQEGITVPVSAVLETIAPGVLVGTGASDALFGDSAAQTILGQGGDDVLWGDGVPLAFTGAIAGQLYRLYQATLARAPDTAGWEGWAAALFDGTQTLKEVTGGFVNSTEFQALYGDLDDAGFVALLYENVLARSASAAESAGWLSLLSAGTSRADVVQGFAQSQEFQNKTANAATEAATQATDSLWSDEVYRIYQATLARDPDAAGFAGWVAELSGGRALTSVISGFVDSQEFQNVYGDLDDAGFVELLYQNVLNRASDAAGLEGWLEILAAGASRADVVAGFAESAEFRAATAAPLAAFMKTLGQGDVLVGGAGENALAGGLYADTFVFETDQGGAHRVLDLEAWDSLEFLGFGYQSAAEALAQMTGAGADVVFDDQGVTVVLEAITLAALGEDQILV